MKHIGKMVVFKSPGQVIITPAVGIVKEPNPFLKGTYTIYLNVSWLCWGLSIRVVDINKDMKQEKGQEKEQEKEQEKAQASDVRRVINALKKGDFEVEIEEPNNIECCQRYDGSFFYILRDDDAKFGVSAGRCTVYVEEFEFVCDLNYGDWSGDNLIEDEDVVDALENADGVICGAHSGADGEWEVYATANGITEGGDYYWCDDDHPKDVESLDGYYEDFRFKYGTRKEKETVDEWTEEAFEANCQDIYDLYLGLRDKYSAELESGAEFTISGDEIKGASEDLYNEMIESIDIQDSDKVEIQATLSKSYFDEVL